MLFNYRYFSRIYYALFLLCLIVVGGTIGFKIVGGEEWSWIEAFYQTIITVSTVGFSEVHYLNDDAKIFTACLIVLSFGTFAYAVSSITSYIVSGDYRKYFKTYRTLKDIKDLYGHVIICGYGRVGSQAAATLAAHKDKYLVIEQDDSIISKFQEEGKVLYLQGDATQDDVLDMAGIMRAKALITTLPSDSENLFVVLTAKSINPRLKVISRASKFTSKKKLRIAGADNVIMPDSLGGSHMAQLVATPDVVEFLDQISIEGENEINLEAISFSDIPEGCKYKSLGDLKEQFRVCNIIGFKTPTGEYIMNPGDDVAIVPNSKVFVLGNAAQISELNEIFGIQI